MKTIISLPDQVFAEAESLARELGFSRNQLYAEAIKSYLQRHKRQKMMDNLNEIYDREPSLIDPLMVKMQALSLPVEEW
jgi:metal-responsive CopG/Arc/MetJ family transcriptional regulator